MRMLTFAGRAGCALTSALLAVLFCLWCPAAEKPDEHFRGFSAFEVEKFENPKYETKEPMPDAWVSSIQEDITQRVIDLHKFRRVQDFDDPKTTGEKPAT